MEKLMSFRRSMEQLRPARIESTNYVDKVQHDIFLEINNNIQNKDYNLNNYQLDNNIKADLSNYIDSINEHS